MESLATRGWEASSVTVIAAEAGTSRGALQHHFPTREDLSIAALDYMFEQRSQILAGFGVPDLSGQDRVAAVTEMLVDIYATSLFRAALQVWAAAAVDPALNERVGPLERRFGREVHRLAVNLYGVDDSDPGVRALIQATLDLARGLALANILTDDSRRRAGVIAAWIPLLARGLTAA